MQLTAMLVALVVLGACKPKPPPAERAQAAAQALKQKLLSRVQAVMKADGPSAAVSVCAGEAEVLTQAVAKEFGVKLGRTSFRLRNSGNTPPAWAADYVARRVAEPVHIDIGNDTTGSLIPIQLAKPCETCHGDPAAMPAELKTTLATYYPDDQATGFKEGDLRGWFWVETPK